MALLHTLAQPVTLPEAVAEVTGRDRGLDKQPGASGKTRLKVWCERPKPVHGPWTSRITFGGGGPVLSFKKVTAAGLVVAKTLSGVNKQRKRKENEPCLEQEASNAPVNFGVYVERT